MLVALRFDVFRKVHEPPPRVRAPRAVAKARLLAGRASATWCPLEIWWRTALQNSRIIARNPAPGTWKHEITLRSHRRRRGAEREHSRDTFVDWEINVTQHGVIMPETDTDKVRRSTRVFMRVRVVVAGKNSDGRRFREACETIVINAHAGLMHLNQPLNMHAILA